MNKYSTPIFVSYIKAGFPSPADDFIENTLDLDEFLIEHPQATFFVKVSGDSMINAGIHSRDILIVDRSLQAYNGSIVVAVIDGEFTVKRYKKIGNTVYLLPENPNYKVIKIPENSDFLIWGVVKHVIHSV